jgi:hypothetical protein
MRLPVPTAARDLAARLPVRLAIPGTARGALLDLGRLAREMASRPKSRIRRGRRGFVPIFDGARAVGRGLAFALHLVRTLLDTKPTDLARGATALAVMGSLILAAGCATPLRLSLAGPSAAAGADEFRDDQADFKFDCRTDVLRVVIHNLSSARPLVIDWSRAFYVDPAGKKHAAIGYAANISTALRQDPPEPLVVGPGESWSGRIHPRDRIPVPSGARFFERPLLDDEDAKPGTVVGLDLPVDAGGGRSAYHEFRFRLGRGAGS